MDHELTLPTLQGLLDSLRSAQTLALATRQVDRLFGLDDVGTTRLKRFARGHNCIIAHTDDCVVFHKMPPGAAPA